VSVDAPRPTTEEKVQGPTGAEDKLHLGNHGFEGSPAVYAQAEIWATERLLLTPGVRVDRLTGVPHTYVQPRLSARLRVSPATWLKAGAGLYHQPPAAQYNDAVLGNPALRAEEAWHFTVGVETHPVPRYLPLGLEVNLFYKDLRYLPVTSDNYLL